MLRIEEYDRAELEAIDRLPNRIIEASRAEVFQSTSYPTRAYKTQGLLRFVDVMQEARFDKTFNTMIGPLADDEFALFDHISCTVAELTETVYGQRRIALNALLRALNVFRHIRLLYPEGNATILEMGPGSGYLGALLLLTGYRYISTDIAQGFYIYQSNLFEKLVGDRHYELALDDQPLGALLRSAAPGTSIHLPYWKFLTLFREQLDFSFDLVTANHMLAEMTDWSRKYALRLLRTLLEQSPHQPAWIFEGWGSGNLTTAAFVNYQFSLYGYSCCHSDDLITVQTLSGHPCSSNALNYPLYLTEDIGRDMLDKLRLDLLYAPSNYQSLENPLSQAILEGREQLSSRQHIGKEALLTRQRQIFGSDDLSDEDEKFLAFINIAH